jgi:lipopolysaccharide/colanic/teichoic acid biosynthesis glycosyltransferase
MKSRNISIWVLLLDLLWASLAFVMSFVIRYGLDWSGAARVSVIALLPFFVAACVAWTFLSCILKLDGFQGGWSLPAVVSHVFTGLLCTMSVLLTLAYLARNYVSRLALLYFGLLLLAGFVGIRCVAYVTLRARRRGNHVWRIVVVGTGSLARELAQKFENHPETLCSVTGLLFPQESSAEDQAFARANPRSITLSSFGVADYLRQQKIDEVILASPYAAQPDFRNLVDRCRECGIRISIVPQLYELYVSRLRLLDLDGLPVLQLREPRASYVYGWAKRAIDLAFTAMLGLPAMVILIPASFCLRLTGHRFLRRETRCGQGGKVFSMFRLDLDRPCLNASPMEHTLDASGITELPQLWNVLRGEMTLVGPRPETPERVQNYSEWQHRRLGVRPGITGLAQVRGLRDSSSSEEKTKLDLQYLMHRSLLMDLSLLLQTMWTLAVRLTRQRLSSPELAHSTSTESELDSQEILFSAHRSQSRTD